MSSAFKEMQNTLELCMWVGRHTFLGTMLKNPSLIAIMGT